MALLRPHKVMKMGVACRLGVVDVVRAHLCAPPWVPGFAGTTGLGLSGCFHSNDNKRTLIDKKGI